MKINIEATGFDVTPTIKAYIESKIGSLARLLKRFETAGEVMALVEVGRTTRHHKHGDVFRAALNLDLPGKVIRAESENEDLRTAVDGVKNKIKDDIEKYKDKLSKHR
ncbi:ribosome-associated translation inhibitor RaiA [Patescibacteria group bacterium]|nr:ribosome-associated translation inhibitor RaiA [Patescibacteria group bacterium]